MSNVTSVFPRNFISQGKRESEEAKEKESEGSEGEFLFAAKGISFAALVGGRLGHKEGLLTTLHTFSVRILNNC